MNIRPVTFEFSSMVQAKPDESYERKNWNRWTFEYIIEGKGTYRIGGKVFRVYAGDVYILPKGLAHSYSADAEEPWKKIFFGVNGKGIDSLLDIYGLSKVYHISDCQCEGLFREFLCARSSDDLSIHEYTALRFHQLCILLQKKSSSNPRYSVTVNRAMEILNDSVEHPLSLRKLATELGISGSQLSRKFRTEVGVTPYDYLINLRMHKACRMLSLTRLSIKEIAIGLCYADAYYFSNAFKAKMGMSPSAYRLKER